MAPKRKDVDATGDAVPPVKKPKKTPAKVEKSEKPAKAEKPAKTAKASKATKLSEPSTGSNGYTAVPTSLIYKCAVKTGNCKIAAFDFDGTLVKTKSGADFPTNAEDWKWFGPDVIQVVKAIYEDGYKIVIFTNQGSIKGALEGKAAAKVEARLDYAIDALGVPVDVFIATQKDENRKPESGMWKYMVANCNFGVEPDLKQCYFVGDAAGRLADEATGTTEDFAASDKEFAENVGIAFKVPQEVFGEGKNVKLRACFDQLAKLLKADRFKASAFRKVSGALAEYPDDVKSGKEAGKLPGIGKASIALIDEWLATGKMATLEELKNPTGEAAEKVGQAKKANSKALAFL